VRWGSGDVAAQEEGEMGEGGGVAAARRHDVAKARDSEFTG